MKTLPLALTIMFAVVMALAMPQQASATPTVCPAETISWRNSSTVLLGENVCIPRKVSFRGSDLTYAYSTPRGIPILGAGDHLMIEFQIWMNMFDEEGNFHVTDIRIRANSPEVLDAMLYQLTMRDSKVKFTGANTCTSIWRIPGGGEVVTIYLLADSFEIVPD